ncbi:unnamed protein product [Alopecurus aequalis]
MTRVPGTGRCCSGKGKRKASSLRHSLEYPCVPRLRRRRLLAFLSRHGFSSTFEAFARETIVFFSIEHLHRLVCQGQWDDAINYVSRFVPSLHMLGSEGIVFFNFLQVHKTLQSIAAGEPNGAVMAEERERYLKKFPNSDPGTVKLTRVLLTMLRCKHLRAAMDWSCVRFKAAEIAKDLITKTPEFNDLLRLLPNCREKPHNILPIGSCSHRRRQMKERGRTSASDIAKFYLQKKRSLPSSIHCEGNSVGMLVYMSGLSCESSWLADITVESVQAGLCRVILQGHPFEQSCNEGFSFNHSLTFSNRGSQL